MGTLKDDEKLIDNPPICSVCGDPVPLSQLLIFTSTGDQMTWVCGKQACHDIEESATILREQAEWMTA